MSILTPQPDLCSNMPRVSVVMSTYNRADFLRESLESLLQLTPPAYEIIVINDGSTDHTAEVLSEYTEKIKFINRSNSGKSSSINYAAAISSGDWIWICDDDDIVIPEAIRHFSIGISKDIHAGFIYAGYGWLIPNRSGNYEEKIPPIFNLPEPADLMGCLLVGQWIPSLCPIAVQREIFLKLGGLREDLRRVEDEDFALRLLASSTGSFVHNCVYLVRQHSGIRGSEFFYFKNEQREAVDIKILRSIYKKNYDTLPLDAYTISEHNRYRIPTNPLILRMITMFRVCLWEESSIDFKILINKTHSTQELLDISYRIALSTSTFTKSKLHDFFESRFWIQLKYTEEKTALRDSILTGIKKGVFWSLKNSTQETKIKDQLWKTFTLLRIATI